MRFYPLEKLINLYDGYSREIRIDYHTLLLLQRGSECFIIEAKCPHREQALDGSHVRGHILECPRHGLRFSLHDGQLLNAGDDPCRPLRVYPVVYEGNEVGTVWD